MTVINDKTAHKLISYQSIRSMKYIQVFFTLPTCLINCQCPASPYTMHMLTGVQGEYDEPVNNTIRSVYLQDDDQ